MFKNPISSVYINITGEPLTNAETLHQKLYEQIFKSVQWIKTVNNMMVNGINTFYEVSPRSTLSAFAKNIAGSVVKTIDVQTILTNYEIP